MAPAITVLKPGDTTKLYPYTIAIVANVALEAPWRSGTFVPDPIRGAPADFNTAATYIVDSLFRRLPGQVEPMLGDPPFAAHVRVLAVWPEGMPVNGANAFVAQDGISNMLVARRDELAAWFAAQHLFADVIYAVSASNSHSRASAWYTTDDDTKAGVPFRLDAVALAHCFWHLIPGTIAIHHTATALTAAHEFQHAASSYTNGQVTDLYVDGGDALNRHVGRPIPSGFRTLDGVAHMSDTARDGLGYPAAWLSYHCALHDPTRPSMMDNYWASAPPEACQNDTITRQFLRDRVRAKMGR